MQDSGRDSKTSTGDITARTLAIQAQELAAYAQIPPTCIWCGGLLIREGFDWLHCAICGGI